jgi:hypothetical protein
LLEEFELDTGRISAGAVLAPAVPAPIAAAMPRTPMPTAAAFNVLLFDVRMVCSVARVPRRGTTRTRVGVGGEHVMRAS